MMTLEQAKGALKAQAEEKLAHRLEHFLGRKFRPFFWIRLGFIARKLKKIEAL